MRVTIAGSVRRWKPKELATLRNLVSESKTDKQIADVLGRTVQSVCHAKCRYGMTSDQPKLNIRQSVHELYEEEGLTIETIQKKLKISMSRVFNELNQLGYVIEPPDKKSVVLEEWPVGLCYRCGVNEPKQHTCP